MSIKNSFVLLLLSFTITSCTGHSSLKFLDNPSQADQGDGTYLFTVYDNSTGGYSLWKSDGTEAGTQKIKDISVQEQLMKFGDSYYFMAYDVTNGVELWKSDGTTAGTVLVKDLNPGSNSSSPSHLTIFKNQIYFVAYVNSDVSLWKSDGTTAGTVLVKNVHIYSDLYVAGNELYFSAQDNTNGVELWKSDGTAAGTVLVKDINAGTGNSSPSSFAVLNDTIYFSADDGVNGVELWKSDGTSSGTMMVKNINASADSYPGELIAFNNAIYFRANDGVNGNELWKSDGTSSGTVMLKDIDTAPSADGVPMDFLVVGDKLYFSAYQNSVQALWQTDGTNAGTIQTPGISNIFYKINYNDEFYYLSGVDLWKINKTTGVHEKLVTTDRSYLAYLTVSQGYIYFYSYASDGSLTYDLWKSDGTSSGTIKVKTGFEQAPPS